MQATKSSDGGYRHLWFNCWKGQLLCSTMGTQRREKGKSRMAAVVTGTALNAPRSSKERARDSRGKSPCFEYKRTRDCTPLHQAFTWALLCSGRQLTCWLLALEVWPSLSQGRPRAARNLFPSHNWRAPGEPAIGHRHLHFFWGILGRLGCHGWANLTHYWHGQLFLFFSLENVPLSL